MTERQIDREAYYNVYRKMLAARVPFAGIDGPVHRIELTPAEYNELNAILWEEDDTDGETMSLEERRAEHGRKLAQAGIGATWDGKLPEER